MGNGQKNSGGGGLENLLIMYVGVPQKLKLVSRLIYKVEARHLTPLHSFLNGTTLNAIGTLDRAIMHGVSEMVILSRPTSGALVVQET